jgi:hypothetical protein
LYFVLTSLIDAATVAFISSDIRGYSPTSDLKVVPGILGVGVEICVAVRAELGVGLARCCRRQGGYSFGLRGWEAPFAPDSVPPAGVLGFPGLKASGRYEPASWKAMRVGQWVDQGGV